MNTLIIPDAHFPFEHRGAVRQVIEIAAQKKPERIVVLGDLWDEYLLGRWPKPASTLTPRSIQEGKRRGREFLEALRALTKRLYFIPGNHEDRLQSRLAEVPMLSWWLGPTRQELPANCEWIEARELNLTTPRGRVYFTHGWRTRTMPGAAAYSMVRRVSVVQGHTHRLALSWADDRLFAIESGWLGDESKYAFRYQGGRAINAAGWKRGYSWIDDNGEPHIESLA